MNSEAASILTRLADSDAEHIHLGRFIGGVVYALEEYDRLALVAPKEPKSDKFYSDEVQNLLSSIQGGVNPPANWLRGFFYNAAVMRLDAAWERSIRVILRDNNKKSNGPGLYKKLCRSEPALSEYNDSMFKRVRKEVNALKHEHQGPSVDIRENPEVLREGLEQLLGLLKRRVA